MDAIAAYAPAATERISVAEAMHPGVVTCPPHVSLAVVARIMAAHRIHAVVVTAPCTELSPPVVMGIVTDLDVVSALAERSLHHRTAGDAATNGGAPPPSVVPNDDVEHAVALMREDRTTHVVVVDPCTARPVGIVSSLDVAEVIAREV
jgi:CBS domain-containing protein